LGGHGNLDPSPGQRTVRRFDNLSGAAEACGMSVAVVPAPSATRRSAETRAKLLAAARLLFARDGYHAVRPQDVAREAGVAQGTFYQYFDDKLACFLAFAEAIDAELMAAVGAALEPAEGFEDRLVRAVEAVLVYSEAHPRELVAMMADSRALTPQDDGASLFDRWAEFWTGVLQTGVAEGRVRNDLDLRLAGASVLGVLRQSSAYGYGHGVGRAAVIDHIRRFILGAVAPDRDDATA
jgi:AcrR family transcriptional regulator